MEQNSSTDATPARTSPLTHRASNPQQRAPPTQPADTALSQSVRQSIGGTPSFSRPASLAATPRAAEELHATVQRTGDGGLHVPGEHGIGIRSGGPATNATTVTPAPPRQEVLVRPRKWAVGGRHQQNYVRLGWKWNHRFAAKMRKDAQKKRDVQGKKDAEAKKKDLESPVVAPQPGDATLGVPTTSHSAAEVEEGVPAVDGAQDGSVTQAMGVDNVDGKEPKKDGAKGIKAKETAFSRLKRMASLLVG